MPVPTSPVVGAETLAHSTTSHPHPTHYTSAAVLKNSSRSRTFQGHGHTNELAEPLAEILRPILTQPTRQTHLLLCQGHVKVKKDVPMKWRC